MTTSADIRAAVVTALTGATDAGSAVYSPYDWPSTPSSYPIVIVSAPCERKVSTGRYAPLFTVTTTIEIIVATQSPTQTGAAGLGVALAAAEKIKAQIETALINNPAVWADASGAQRVQQFLSVDSQFTTSSAGTLPTAQLTMHFCVEFMQGPADFYPIPSTALQGFDAGMQQPAGTAEPGFSISFSTSTP